MPFRYVMVVFLYALFHLESLKLCTILWEEKEKPMGFFIEHVV